MHFNEFILIIFFFWKKVWLEKISLLFVCTLFQLWIRVLIRCCSGWRFFPHLPGCYFCSFPVFVCCGFCSGSLLCIRFRIFLFSDKGIGSFCIRILFLYALFLSFFYTFLVTVVFYLFVCCNYCVGFDVCVVFIVFFFYSYYLFFHVCHF